MANRTEVEQGDTPHTFIVRLAPRQSQALQKAAKYSRRTITEQFAYVIDGIGYAPFWNGALVEQWFEKQREYYEALRERAETSPDGRKE
jgi:hypothetical protein